MSAGLPLWSMSSADARKSWRTSSAENGCAGEFPGYGASRPRSTRLRPCETSSSEMPPERPVASDEQLVDEIAVHARPPWFVQPFWIV